MLPCLVELMLSRPWSMLEQIFKRKDNLVIQRYMLLHKMVIWMLFKHLLNMEQVLIVKMMTEIFHSFLVRSISSSKIWIQSFGLFSLSLAVRGTHAEIIDYLLKAGSDIHQNGWLGQSAVHTASKSSTENSLVQCFNWIAISSCYRWSSNRRYIVESRNDDWMFVFWISSSCSWTSPTSIDLIRWLKTLQQPYNSPIYSIQHPWLEKSKLNLNMCMYHSSFSTSTKDSDFQQYILTNEQYLVAVEEQCVCVCVWVAFTPFIWCT